MNVNSIFKPFEYFLWQVTVRFSVFLPLEVYVPFLRTTFWLYWLQNYDSFQRTIVKFWTLEFSMVFFALLVFQSLKIDCCEIWWKFSIPFQIKLFRYLCILIAFLAFDLHPLIFRDWGSVQNRKVVAWVNLAFLDACEEIFVSDGVGKTIAFSYDLIVSFWCSTKEISVQDDWNSLLLENIIFHMNHSLFNF